MWNFFFFKIAAIEVMTSLIISMFLKNYAKNGYNMFFSKANLVTATKKYFQGVFSTFESQDNMQIEYI